MKNALEIMRGNRFPTWGAMDEFDALFDRALKSPWFVLEKTPETKREIFHPLVDVVESAEAYSLSVDLPGVKREDVKVDLKQNILTISGERKREGETSNDGMRAYERIYGRFERSFTLPQVVDVSRVEAKLEDGVLHVTLPKSELAQPRSIEIKTN